MLAGNKIKTYLCRNIWEINFIIIKTTNMATEIRVIPTLQGEEAKKFLENAEWTEAHPGQGEEISKEDIQLMRNYLREMNLLWFTWHESNVRSLNSLYQPCKRAGGYSPKILPTRHNTKSPRTSELGLFWNPWAKVLRKNQSYLVRTWYGRTT